MLPGPYFGTPSLLIAASIALRLLAAINRAVLTSDYGGNFGRLIVGYGLELARTTVFHRRVCDMAGITLGLAGVALLAGRAGRSGEWVDGWLGTAGESEGAGGK